MTGHGCPSIIFSFEVTGSGAGLDSSVFSYNSATLEFDVLTLDAGKIASYPITLKANLDGYSNFDTLDFTVDIIDACMAGTFDMSPMTDFGPQINYSIFKSVNT